MLQHSVQSLSCAGLCDLMDYIACQASLSITNSWSLLKFMSIESAMASNHLILCRSFSSCLQCFPASGSFPMNQFFTSGGQSIGVSALASVIPINIQDLFPLGTTGWISSPTGEFPLGLTGLISLMSKGLSRDFSSTTIRKHQFFGAQFYLWSNSHIQT